MSPTSVTGVAELLRETTGSVLVHAPWHRKYIGRAFNRLVRLLTGLPFKDTQCGFKFFTADALD